MIKLSQFVYYTSYGMKQIFTKSDKPLIGSIIITDICNLSCLHCAVNNKKKTMYTYDSICRDMKKLFSMGVRILMLYGGEPFLWNDSGKNLRDIVKRAKKIGFFVVNIVTNGTYQLNVPEADTILVSLDGGKEKHEMIRGKCYDRIMQNIRNSPSPNICLYCALNRLNKNEISKIGEIVVQEHNIKAVSFNFHTPYPGTENLSLTKSEKSRCCSEIRQLMKDNVPVFNLRSAFRHIVNNSFKRPISQTVIMENGKIYKCGRCIDVNGLCEQCGYFCTCEYSLAFNGNPLAIADMLYTYTKYM